MVILNILLDVLTVEWKCYLKISGLNILNVHVGVSVMHVNLLDGERNMLITCNGIVGELGLE